MTQSSSIKELALNCGADLVGIASIKRFKDAPKGFHPTDVFSECKSVLVVATQIPESVLLIESKLPYTFAKNGASTELNSILYKVAVSLEQLNIAAIPIASSFIEYYDADSKTSKGMISVKHAGWLAGLGVIGRNGLLSTPKYGNLVTLGLLLLDVELEPDPIINYDFCSDNCNICIDSCPSGALLTTPTNQKLCTDEQALGKTSNGTPFTNCYNCRKICPLRAGWVIPQNTGLSKSIFEYINS